MWCDFSQISLACKINHTRTRLFKYQMKNTQMRTLLGLIPIEESQNFRRKIIFCTKALFAYLISCNRSFGIRWHALLRRSAQNATVAPIDGSSRSSHWRDRPRWSRWPCFTLNGLPNTLLNTKKNTKNIYMTVEWFDDFYWKNEEFCGFSTRRWGFKQWRI